MKLKDIAQFQIGDTVSNIEKLGTVSSTGNCRLYEKNMFTYELGKFTNNAKSRYVTFNIPSGNIKFVQPDDGIISIMTNEMVVSSGKDENNYPLVLTANFAKVTILDSTIVDMNYLAYWFNYDDEALRQLAIASEVSSTIIKRLNINQLKNLEITLPPLEIQKNIGLIYINQLTYNRVMEEEIFLKNAVALEKIKKINTISKRKITNE